MRFTKMQGAGNDYVYVDCFHETLPMPPNELSIQLSRPHFGIGSDGLILIEPCEGAHARMRIFNKDGSEGEMCGNGIRCAAKYLYDSGIAPSEQLDIMTGNGIRRVWVNVSAGKAVSARVDMGEPCFEPARIPVNSDTNTVVLELCGKKLKFFCLNTGNPHAVTFDCFPEGEEFALLGRAAETHSVFPQDANVSFAKVTGREEIHARIWERGSGPTLACGSGATATMVAARFQGLVGDRAYVDLPGGRLLIEYDADTNHVFMTGDCVEVFTGDWKNQ
ncbi:MAG: diaminopimelate epimerase [Clostridiales bacterium]|nr:diaminopimelate epimerase [Clostridiales bacterium]